MNKIANNRLLLLRNAMANCGVSAFLVNGADPHLGEYVPHRWKSRAYISGFTGSFGWLAIADKCAALWTDSRYYIQADEELKSSGFDMIKAGVPESISIEEWLVNNVPPHGKVALDGWCYSIAEITRLKQYLEKFSIELITNEDLLDSIWIDRPMIPEGSVREHLIEFAGETRVSKIKRISAELQAIGADLTLVTALDDLAWTFNLRGADVEYNPVALGFGIVGDNRAWLFVDSCKIPLNFASSLVADGVMLYDYNEFVPFLKNIYSKTILVDYNRTNYAVFSSINSSCNVIHGLSIPYKLKAIKNSIEIEGARKAMIADGVALLRFQQWLHNSVGRIPITEWDVATQLTHFRSEFSGLIGNSFYPIVAYKAHGAIVHFHVTKQNALPLKAEGVLLIDSGGQYLSGTTDITRAVSLGDVTNQIQRDFTLVLKGMISLSSVRFLKGTSGCHLDVLARNALWQYGLNYGHGTGHGVGASLNVHEGPQSIRMDLNNYPILPGMIMSNEPGLYRVGEYGLRCENLMVCIPSIISEFGEFFAFETLTLYPFDRKLIDKSLLNKVEIEWINNYHAMVFEKLSPILNENETNYLAELTKEI